MASILNGWSLVGIDGADGATYWTIDLAGAVIPVDGIFVISTSSASFSLSGISDFVANVDWQNGADAVQLLNGLTIADALQYGNAGSNNAGEGTPAPDVPAGFSLSRDSSGTDTDDNLSDFLVSNPTPGSALQSPVPVPAAVWLFGSGLLGLVGMARRKKAP